MRRRPSPRNGLRGIDGHSALRADSKRGYRWPCPRPHMSGNYLNINHKKCKFLYDLVTCKQGLFWASDMCEYARSRANALSPEPFLFAMIVGRKVSLFATHVILFAGRYT